MRTLFWAKFYLRPSSEDAETFIYHRMTFEKTQWKVLKRRTALEVLSGGRENYRAIFYAGENVEELKG